MISMVGLIFLFIFSKILADEERFSLAFDDNEQVYFKANVISTEKKGNITFIDAHIESKERIIFFDGVNLTNETINVKGRISIFKGKRSIIADTIEIP